MPCPTAYFNGKLVPLAQAQVSIDAPAFKYGAMVFEGIRAYWNERLQELFVFRLEEHSARLEDSVRIMRMNTELTRRDFSQAVIDVLQANDLREDGHVRQMIYVDGGGPMEAVEPVGHAILAIAKGPWFPPGKEGLHLGVSSWQRISDACMPPRVKCAANYQNGRLALLQAGADGYDGAILLNAAGKVTEEPRACIFLRRGEQIVTPRLTDSILESVTRSTLITLFRELHQIEVVEREIDRTELYVAQEVFICGSGLEVIPVIAIDRQPIGDGKPGATTQMIRRDYLKAARGDIEAYRHWLTPVHGSRQL